MRVPARFLPIALVALAFVFGGLKNSFAETRVALVIGNGAYRNAPQLPNPTNDAADVVAALKRLGFETTLATDLDKNGMDQATIQFARATRTADVALFYYSGHALQFGGVNYLLPVDTDLRDETNLRRMTRVDEVVGDLTQAKNLRILVLDSCRDNPFAEQLKRSIGATRAMPLQRGLAKIDSPQGMIVAYSTQAGRTAEDGSGRNSPYTTAFLKRIDEKEEIGSIFRQVSADVYETTRHQQLPELSLSLIGEFYLKGRVEITAKPEDATAREFEAAERVNSAAGWDAFLAQHPDGFYAALAREKKAALAAASRAPASGPGAPQARADAPAASDAERRAARKANWDACNDPDFKGVDGCSRIIEARNETPHQLAIAFARRAAYYGNGGNFSKAVSDFSEAIQVDPEFPNWWYARGLQYENLGQLDRAHADLSAAIRLKAAPEYYSKRGLVYEKLGNPAQAMNDFEKALGLDPANKDAQAGLARLKRP